MTKKSPKSKQTDDLRKRAEKKIPGSADSTGKMSAPEIQKLVHELHVHQIELEMQNEALRQSQAETAESQYKYSDLYDFAPVGYFTLDKKGHIIEANVTGASLLGAEKRSLAKQPFQRFITPGHFSIFQSHLQKALESRSKQTCKLKLTGKEGSLFDALIDTIAVIGDEGKFDHYRSTVTDITEITRAEALRESEIKYRGLYESTHDGIVMTDIKGNIVECNRAYSDMLGYSEKEIKGLTYQQTTPAKWYDMERDIVINKILKTGYSDIYEKEYIKKDDTVFPVSIRVWAIKDEAGNITGMWGIIRDITEHKQIEQTLRLSMERLQLALDAANSGIWEWDLRTNANIWSEELWKLYGLEPHCYEPTYKAWLQTIHPDDRAKTEQVVLESARKGRELNTEWRALIPDGEERWLMSRGRPLRDANGQVERFIGVVMDITERKKIEAILRKHLSELEYANKELESFSYSVSHDLRAPLRAIDGYARLILKKQGDKFDQDTLDKFNVIRSSTHQMGQLIDDLLRFSRLGRKHMSPTHLDMDIVVKDAWKEVQASDPERKIKPTIESMPPCYGDMALIKQVLINLLSNAVKFTKYKDAAEIVAGGYADGSEIVYYIRDNGVGFDMAYYDKLFGVFQRLHSTDQFEGTGVGLAIVQRIIHRHGGKAWAEGKVDEGATFYFSLPLPHTHTQWTVRSSD